MKPPLRHLLFLSLLAASLHARAAKPYLILAPMIGHVSSTNALIWANSSEPARLTFHISTNADLSHPRTVSGDRLIADEGNMGFLNVTRLHPETRYYYTVYLNGDEALVPPYPSFTTAPREGAAGRVRFLFASCVGYHGSDASAGYADLSRTNFDLLLMLGDNVYSNTNDPAVQRQFYFDQRHTAGWRGHSPMKPTYAIWDDHDYGPDNSDRLMKSKEKSLKTFTELWANPASGETNNPGIYFQFTRGQVQFFMLDGRYHRDPNRAKNLPHKTMLGTNQLAWLKRELLASKARVKVLVSGGEWQVHGTDDSWRSFKEERDDILKTIQDHAIEGILLLSGDRHYTGGYHVEGKWIEVTTGPLGSSPATAKNAPESFFNFSDTKGHFYCLYDINTATPEPQVTLEVYRVGDGLVRRQAFSWDEVNGKAKLKLLPSAPKAEAKTVKTQGKVASPGVKVVEEK